MWRILLAIVTAALMVLGFAELAFPQAPPAFLSRETGGTHPA
jgi:hypothetical protein